MTSQWTRWRLKSPASPLFTQQYIQRRSKKTSKLRDTSLCGIYRWTVNSPHKWPVTRKMFPFDDVIMVGYGICHKGWCCTSTSRWTLIHCPLRYIEAILQVYFPFHFTNWYLCRWSWVNPRKAYWWWVNIGSGNDLVSSVITCAIVKPDLCRHMVAQMLQTFWNGICFGKKMLTLS